MSFQCPRSPIYIREYCSTICNPLTILVFTMIQSTFFDVIFTTCKMHIRIPFLSQSESSSTMRALVTLHVLFSLSTYLYDLASFVTHNNTIRSTLYFSCFLILPKTSYFLVFIFTQILLHMMRANIFDLGYYVYLF